MKHRSRQGAFTFLEIFVVLGIIAMLLALLVPFALRAREGGRSAACVKNMQLIGKAIASYAAENDDRLPGPLTMDQYPAGGGGDSRDGQLFKQLGKHLDKSAFTYPSWERAEKGAKSPVFLANVEKMQPFDQSPWGEIGGKPALKSGDLKQVQLRIGDKLQPWTPKKYWALTEADQIVTKILNRSDAWATEMPAKAVHVSHRNALYFDWHVESLVLVESSVSPPTTE